jgi:cyclopropane-fatty-acyl-phospholipid synthase
MTRQTVATRMVPVIRALIGADPPVAVRYWDGSASGAPSSPVTVNVRSRRALRRLLWAPGELGLARAYVAGDLDIEGDVYALFDARRALASPDEALALRFDVAGLVALVRAAATLGALGPPPAAPPEELRLRGGLHTPSRDSGAVRSHYDVGNEFYRLVLGSTMTYSCAYWDEGVATLEEAQEAKYEHICRKLALRPGMRLLDVGCGWGGMVLHAARRHGVEAVGITLSAAQRRLAEARVEEAGLAGRVEIRLQDYRDLRGEPFDAISSIGMFEHVGERRLREYMTILLRLLTPEGRLLNHAISRPAGPAALEPRSFINRYVFPDGELHEVGGVVTALQETGFEVRDVESLREHYARTLRCWVANLEAQWDQAVALVGAPRARIWRLYMAGCARNFEDGRTTIHQVLAVRQGAEGTSGMAATRRPWYETPRRGPSPAPVGRSDQERAPSLAGRPGTG